VYFDPPKPLKKRSEKTSKPVNMKNHIGGWKTPKNPLGKRDK
jgi:hypothetical protein